MYDSISGISLKGALFSTVSNLKFYQKPSERLAIIYGKNGSGKSTLSRAFFNCDGNTNEFGLSSSFVDFNGDPIAYTQQHVESTFVFNEDYIHKNVRVQENGLNSIVMFGEQVDLQEKIATAENELKSADEKHKKQGEECAKFEGNTLVTAPLYHKRQMKSLLQGDDSWAGIDSKIRGNRQNSAVTDGLIDEICAITSSKSREELKTDFDRTMKLYTQVASGASKITLKIDPITVNVDEAAIIQVLEEKIQKPDLTDREKLILDAIVGGKQGFYEEVQNHFSDAEISMCPYCLQPVSTEYKGILIDSIQNVLSKAVDEHKAKIKLVKLSKVHFEKSVYEIIDTAAVGKCNDLINAVNSDVDQYNALLDKKADNVYTPINQEILGLVGKITEANIALSALEVLRENYNQSIVQKTEIFNSLVKLNKEISRFKIEENYNQYILLSKHENEGKSLLKSLVEEKERIQNELNRLLQQKKNIKIAVEHINKGLQYVFFSPKRLELCAENDAYALYSNGSPVKPSSVSCGERNIIALCYFFTQMMGNLNEADMYTKESLIVIDDPVSSFDFENRIGILSYLKSQILRVMLGNNMSKLILFSHDLSTLYDIEKMIEEVKEAGEKKYGNSSTDFHLHELQNKVLKVFRYKKRNEYTLLLECIYRYGAEETNEDEIVIGNVMRRALEAFSTFEYKKGIDKISCDHGILALMGDQKYSEYFENLMYRLVLNGESHSEERVRNLIDPHFFNTTTETEKIRTAKDILCFIRLLNKKHIESHLCEIPNAVQKIDGWCQGILAN